MIKVPDYSVMEQLKKTHAQISLMSLLLQSKEHRHVLTKIMNEAHDPEIGAFLTHEDIEEVIQDLNHLFCEVNMVQVGEGTSHADVQLVVSGVELNN
ncbi:hypothetical protein H5410_004484, partial [Solanum commersonii]